MLRPVEAGDVDALHEMRRDEEWAFFGAPTSVSRPDVERSVRRALDDAWRHGPYVVITLDEEVVGDAVLQVDEADEHANLGSAVARPQWADPRNVGSIRVLEAIPMAYEGTLRRHHIRRGERVDRALYGVLRDEWLANRP